VHLAAQRKRVGAVVSFILKLRVCLREGLESMLAVGSRCNWIRGDDLAGTVQQACARAAAAALYYFEERIFEAVVPLKQGCVFSSSEYIRCSRRQVNSGGHVGLV